MLTLCSRGLAIGLSVPQHLSFPVHAYCMMMKSLVHLCKNSFWDHQGLLSPVVEINASVTLLTSLPCGSVRLTKYSDTQYSAQGLRSSCCRQREHTEPPLLQAQIWYWLASWNFRPGHVFWLLLIKFSLGFYSSDFLRRCFLFTSA